MAKNTLSINKPSGRQKHALTDSNLLFIIAMCIFVFLYVFAIAAFGNSFRVFQQFFDLFNNNASLIVLTCGLSIVMVGGGIDISVGGATALVTAACAVFLDSPSGNVWGSLAIALGIGLAFGIIQGFLVAYLEIQPFIITLAGMFFARGMATVITRYSHTVQLQSFSELRNIKLAIPFLGRWARSGAWIPVTIDMSVFIALAIAAVIFFILKWSRFGRNLYAVGGNSQSALTLGIDVKRTKFLSYLICGLLSGIAGFLFLIKTGSGYAQHAMTFEMKAIASSIIGGVLLTGGVGNVVGAFFGVISMATITAVVNSAGLKEAFWQDIITGAMLGLAILLQGVVLSRRRKGGARLLLPKWLVLHKQK